MVAVRTFVALAALLLSLVALPAGALAQGAGDEQYQDPFGDEQSQEQPTPEPAQPPPAAAPGVGGSNSAPPPAAASPSQSQPTPAPATPAQSGDQLPYTGVDAGLLALAGAGLLSAGIALRRRADHQR